MKKHKLIILSAIVLCCILSFGTAAAADLPRGGGYRDPEEYDEWYEEDYGPDGEEWYYEYGPEASDDLFYEDSYWEDWEDWEETDFPDGVSSEESRGKEDRQEQYTEEDAPTWERGLGSASEAQGRVILVSVFLDDANHCWDFTRDEDCLLREHALEYTGIAASYLSQSAAFWGHDLEFVYDWEQYDDLYYEMSLDMDIIYEEEDPTADMNEMIEDTADPDALKEEYDADSIVFLAFVNTPLSSTSPSFTIPYDDSLKDDIYEICYILVGCDGEEETPAAYAHEILHTFGAPDLYEGNSPVFNYNIDRDFVTYCEVYHPNEIMVTTYEADTDEPLYDRISNEVSEITAYYVGWTDSSREAEEFHLQESQHSNHK